MNMRIRHLNIEVTKRCNQRCFYCFNNSGIGLPATEFTPDQWLKILGRLSTNGLESIHLTGGEPFAYPHAVTLLEGAQKIGLSTSILSNGFRVKELASLFPETFGKLAVAQISLDSMNEETHNERRGYPRAWQDAISAVRTLRELTVPVEVSCVVSDTNLADLKAVASFCATMSAGLIIRPIVAAGRAATQRISDSFAHDLERSAKVLIGDCKVRLVADRFHYVADESEGRPSQSPGDIHTAHSDGRLRFGRGRNTNLLSLAV